MKRILLSACRFATLLCLAPLAGAENFPKAGWTPAPNPDANPDAPAGGQLCVFAHQSPMSFNYYLDNNAFSADLFGLLYESLLAMNPATLDYDPALAERWSVSDDKTVFTFHLNPAARWSDGTPVTAADVRWTFDAIMNPDHMTGPHKVALETFLPPEIVSDRCIRFTARAAHWRNLQAVGGFQILPRHAFKDKAFNKLNFEFPVVSGPYRLGEVKDGLYTILERRPDWWARALPMARGVANFDRLKFRFFAEQENAFEAFKKGDIDLFAVYMARLWMNETSGEKFDRHWIVKQKVYNHNPTGFQGFAMNMRRPPFNDVRVRQALGHLLNRERMNQTLMYNQYVLHRSYFEDLYDARHPCPNPPVTFDPGKARRLLAEAGWNANPRTGLLEKEGQPFTFRFLTRDASSEKFLSIFAEDLRNAGIAMQIEQKDGAAWTRDMDAFNYDMTWAAWGAAIFKDPEGMWSSKEADRRGSINITGFRNAEVDRLIERQKTSFEVAVRHAICREIDRLVYAEYPYILLWNINYTRLLYWNKFGTPPSALGKYGTEGNAYWLWWHDEDSAADLKQAMKDGATLPAARPEVHFDLSGKGTPTP